MERRQIVKQRGLERRLVNERRPENAAAKALRLPHLQLAPNFMSKLTAIKKQIAALEAEAERISKHEMSAAIAKIKEIMSTYGLTIEHLQAAVAGKGRTAAKTVKPKRAGGGVAKYADPKTGKTWSGFGRAPAWIASAKTRDAFLVDKSGLKASEPAAKAPVAKKKSPAKAVSATKATKPAAKKAVAVAKKATRSASTPVAAKKKPSAKKAARKSAAKKSAQKKAAPNGAAGASTVAEGAALSAT
jgi:DNA-binding protein H-NS